MIVVSIFLFNDEYVSLKGHKQEKYNKEHFGKLTDFISAKKTILEMYPDGHIPILIINIHKKFRFVNNSQCNSTSETNICDKTISDVFKTLDIMNSPRIIPQHSVQGNIGRAY